MTLALFFKQHGWGTRSTSLDRREASI